MIPDKGIWGWGSNFEQRFIPDYDRLGAMLQHLRDDHDYKVVLTMGSWDIIHIGHMLYLEKAREFGQVLVVGVDSDEKIRRRKGEGRPVVPEDERLQMLTMLRSVTIVTLKHADDPKWHLIKTVKPDILIASARTEYSEEELEQLKEFCGRVEVLPSQAQTSTTARIRQMEVNGGSRLAELIQEGIPELVNNALQRVREGK